MGLVKTYQRYSIVSQFNVVGSSRANVVLLKRSGNRPKSSATEENFSYLAASGANEDINIWDTRKGELVSFLARTCSILHQHSISSQCCFQTRLITTL